MYFNIVCSKGLTGSYAKLQTLIKPGRSFCKNFFPIAKQSLQKLKTGGVCRRFTDLSDKPNGLCHNTINMRDKHVLFKKVEYSHCCPSSCWPITRSGLSQVNKMFTMWYCSTNGSYSKKFIRNHLYTQKITFAAPLESFQWIRTNCNRLSTDQ